MLEDATDNKLPSIDENAELEEQVTIFSKYFSSTFLLKLFIIFSQINCIQQEFSSYCVKIEEEMEKLKVENEKLKSQIIIPVEKVDREVPNCRFKEECEKCHENFKVCFLYYI